MNDLKAPPPLASHLGWLRFLTATTVHQSVVLAVREALPKITGGKLRWKLAGSVGFVFMAFGSVPGGILVL